MDIFQCYFWERKLACSLVAIACAVGFYFILLNVGKTGFVVAIVASIFIGIGIGNVVYVITSESFITNCSCEAPIRIYDV